MDKKILLEYLEISRYPLIKMQSKKIPCHHIYRFFIEKEPKTPETREIFHILTGYRYDNLPGKVRKKYLMLAHNGLNRKISCWQRWPDELHEGQIWYSEVCSILFIEAEIEAEKKMNQRRERARNHITPNMAVARFELNFPFADHGDNSPGLFSRTYDWAPGPC